ncbi:hypothetical protein B0A79_17350 [Flavobacterium piscis]|nr:hypothetical protein B0A79_17350 [Flavobacterium piscis]
MFTLGVVISSVFSIAAGVIFLAGALRAAGFGEVVAAVFVVAFGVVVVGVVGFAAVVGVALRTGVFVAGVVTVFLFSVTG